MKSFYRTVYTLRKLREDARELMADPLAFQKNEAMNRLQEEKPKLAQAKKDKQRLFNEDNARENELYEEDMKVQWNTEQEEEQRAEELAQRKELIESARKAVKWISEEETRKAELIVSVPEYDHAQYKNRVFQAQINHMMHLEEQKQRLLNFASTDKNVRFAEYQASIDRMMTCDLSRFKIGTDAQLLENVEENMDLLNSFAQISELTILAIGQGMEIPKERREEIWKRYSFFIDLKGFYESQLKLMSMDGYAQHTAAEEPKTLEETEKVLKKAEASVQRDQISYYATMMTKYVNVADGGSLLDRTKTVQELWDSYEPPKMHEKLADAKAI